MRRPTLVPRTRAGRAVAVATAVLVAAAGVFTAGAATADQSTPRSDRDIPNLGQVESQIEAYYGDTTVGGEHYASPDSPYAHQVAGIEARAKAYLATAVHHAHGRPAIVLDVDDTTLLTYNYEQEQGFGYTPASNSAYIATKTMAAVFGMPQLVDWAAARGVTVFYVTGRPEAQRDVSAANLAAVGYTPAADAQHFFLKNSASPPAYLSCGSTCTTEQYKSGTRAHIESEGYDVLANFGDQYSDLSGGYADRDVKMPNPMYYIP
jgi:HAD superfamily, subfamily IIIB (Acid phosphatase)